MNATITRRCVALGMLALAMGGASASGETVHGIEVTDAWIRPPSKTSPQAMAFFDIVNHGDQIEHLTGVTSPGGEGKLNQQRWRGSGAYVTDVKAIAIPSLGRVTLKPGQYYVTLRDAPDSLAVGKVIPLTLHFETAGSMDVSAKVSNQLLGNLR